MYDPRTFGAQCDRCPLRFRKPVPPERSAAPVGVIVGEGPGPQETLKGYPFAGASGVMRDRELTRNGLRRSQFHTTNAMLCEPITKSDAELIEAAECCRPRLERELAEFAGKPLLAIGKYAMRALTEGKRIDDERGFVRNSRIVQAVVLTTIHPARVMREPILRGRFNADIAKWARLVSGEKPALTFADLRLYVDDPEALRRIRARKAVTGFDIETDGIRPDTANPTLISFGDDSEAVSFHWPAPDFVKNFYSLGRLVSCNGLGFDEPILRRFGWVNEGGIEDIRDLRRTLAPDSPLSLAYMVSLTELVFPWKVGADTQDPYYNAMDSLMTARVWAAHMKAVT